MASKLAKINSNRSCAVKQRAEFFHRFKFLELAASSITFNTSAGCESIITWHDANSVVLAFILFAIKRSRSGCIVLSFLATTYQVGLCFQAGSPLLSSNTVCEAGVCVA